MTDLIRTAQSGGDWTAHDLDAYNVSVVDQPFATFFGTPQLPDVSANLRTFSELPDRAAAIAQTADGDTYKLLYYLDIATSPEVGEDASVNSLVRRLVEKLGYAPGYRTVISHQLLPLLLCGVCCTVQVDVGVCDRDNILLLLIQHDSSPDDTADPEPRLIAAAVAAYQRNNAIRVIELHLPALDEITFPCIMLVGTFPTFYKIRVTAALSHAVIDGTYPPTTTIVDHYIPKTPRGQSEGMKPLDNRIAILRHFEPFEQFVVETELIVSTYVLLMYLDVDDPEANSVGRTSKTD